MKDKLEKYINGEIDYTPIMNIISRNRNIDAYEILGKYAYNDVLKRKLPDSLSFIKDDLESKNIIKNVMNFDKAKRTYNFFGIMLLTHSAYVINKLKELFGEPLYHDEFGEGFEGEYDEDNDEYGEPDIKESFASYFIKINNVDFHIGYDHRGLTIEVKVGTSFDELLEALKKFIYLCYTKNNDFK